MAYTTCCFLCSLKIYIPFVNNAFTTVHCLLEHQCLQLSLEVKDGSQHHITTFELSEQKNVRFVRSEQCLKMADAE